MGNDTMGIEVKRIERSKIAAFGQVANAEIGSKITYSVKGGAILLAPLKTPEPLTYVQKLRRMSRKKSIQKSHFVDDSRNNSSSRSALGSNYSSIDEFTKFIKVDEQ